MHVHTCGTPIPGHTCINSFHPLKFTPSCGPRPLPHEPRKQKSRKINSKVASHRRTPGFQAGNKVPARYFDGRNVVWGDSYKGVGRTGRTPGSSEATWRWAAAVRPLHPRGLCWPGQRKEVELPEPTARDAQQDLGITEFGETL